MDLASEVLAHDRVPEFVDHFDENGAEIKIEKIRRGKHAGALVGERIEVSCRGPDSGSHDP